MDLPIKDCEFPLCKRLPEGILPNIYLGEPHSLNLESRNPTLDQPARMAVFYHIDIDLGVM